MAIKVSSSLTHPRKKQMFWKWIWEKDASHNDKAMWIAELKAELLA